MIFLEFSLNFPCVSEAMGFFLRYIYKVAAFFFLQISLLGQDMS